MYLPLGSLYLEMLILETEPPYCEEAQATQRGHVYVFWPTTPAKVPDMLAKEPADDSRPPAVKSTSASEAPQCNRDKPFLLCPVQTPDSQNP